MLDALAGLRNPLPALWVNHLPFSYATVHMCYRRILKVNEMPLHIPYG